MVKELKHDGSIRSSCVWVCKKREMEEKGEF